jgi:hypothetical protein
MMMRTIEARRQVRLHSQAWADEAIDTWGEDAAAFLRSVEGGFSRAERYAFRQVRKAIKSRTQPTLSLRTKMADFGTRLVGRH